MSILRLYGERLREIRALKAELAARDELLRDIDDLLMGTIFGADLTNPEAWLLILATTRAYRVKIKEALGGKEP